MNHAAINDPELYTRRALLEAGAIRSGHFVLKSWRHSEYYINKDDLGPDVLELSNLAELLALATHHLNPEVVLAPAVGAISLGAFTAYHLSRLANVTVESVYAEKEGESFVLRRMYPGRVCDRRTLVVEDILTTGLSARSVVRVGKEAGAKILAVAALVNRGNVTAKTVEAPELLQLLHCPLESWEEASCPLCAKRVPISTDLGHGQKYLHDRAKAALIEGARAAGLTVVEPLE